VAECIIAYNTAFLLSVLNVPIHGRMARPTSPKFVNKYTDMFHQETPHNGVQHTAWYSTVM